MIVLVSHVVFRVRARSTFSELKKPSASLRLYSIHSADTILVARLSPCPVKNNHPLVFLLLPN